MLEITDMLACPACSKSHRKLEAVDNGWRCTACGGVIASDHGIIEGQWADVNYREIKDDAFDELLALSSAHGWMAAATRCADIPGVNPEYLAKVSRADFQYLLPLHPDTVVLDVGAGLGAIAQVLAPRVHTYVALENDRRRIQFTQLRLGQQGINNVVFLHANVLGNPLQAGLFDVIILNGVLEWLGLQGHEPAGDIQREALRELYRLLKPGGMLYVGTDNRYALAQLRGAPEPHSMLPYVGVVPRRMADFLVKRDYRRGKGWSRSPMLKTGFRTWTWSLRGYHKLLASAGFEKVNTWLPHPTYNQPHRIVPVEPGPISCFLTSMISRKSAWGRWGRRLGRLALTKNTIPALYRQVAGFFLFTARKPMKGDEAPLAFLDALTAHLREHWSALDLPRTPPSRLRYILLGISGQWPKTALGFADKEDTPAVVVKIARDEHTLYRMQREQENIPFFAGRCSLPPAPVLARVAGHDVTIRAALRGSELGRVLDHRRPHRAEDLLRQAGDWLQVVLEHREERNWTRDEISAYFMKMKGLLPELPPDVHALLDRDMKQVMACGQLPLTPCHGDFTLANVWLCEDGRVCPVDWEEASIAHWPLMDLTFLAYDLSIKYRRVAMLDGARRALADCFDAFTGQLGIAPGTGLPLSRIVLAELMARMASRGRDIEVINHIIEAIRSSAIKNKPMDFL
ncbi:MAG: methyltransferase domain-containing protein [Spartobacteria bacterium]|nr:methyltransferase domain-containing protein [Spartobacteria bacterium]